MNLTKNQVRKMAKLANLPVDSNEEDQYSGQLSKILEYFEQLNQVDTNELEPTFNVGNLSNVMGEDKVESGLTQNEALQNAKSKDDDLFKVKAIFEENG